MSGGSPGPTTVTTEQMSLVDVLGELTQRGIDFTGIFDKAVLLQHLEDARSTAEQPSEPGLRTPEPEPELRGAPEPEPVLAQPGLGEELLQLEVAGHCVRMQVRSVMGLAVWAAASAAAERGVEMLRTLSNQMSPSEPAPVALELGAGGALPTLLALAAGQQMVATDGDADVVALMRRNFALNGHERVRSLAPRQVDWTKTSDVDALLADWPHGFPLIIAADVFWNRGSMVQFLASAPKLLDKTGRSPPPSLLLAMSDDLFLDLATHAVTAAASYGLKLVAQESVTGASVASSAYGTVLREDSKATLLIFCHEHINIDGGRPFCNAVDCTPGRMS